MRAFRNICARKLIPNAPTQVDVCYHSIYGLRNIAVLSAGHNDLRYNGSRTADDVYTDIETWCTGRRAAGFKVIICTLAPATDVESYEARRLALNREFERSLDYFC